MTNLPRGIWFEPQYNRYRVRLYKNKIPHLLGYFPTETAALEGLRRLRAKLALIPKKKRTRGNAPTANSISSLADRIYQLREYDPRSFVTNAKH